MNGESPAADEHGRSPAEKQQLLRPESGPYSMFPGIDSINRRADPAHPTTGPEVAGESIQVVPEPPQPTVKFLWLHYLNEVCFRSGPRFAHVR